MHPSPLAPILAEEYSLPVPRGDSTFYYNDRGFLREPVVARTWYAKRVLYLTSTFMPIEGPLAPVAMRARAQTIIRPHRDPVGRKIMSDTNSDVNFCIDSKLDVIRGDGKCSPGGSAVWGHFIERSDEDSAARLRGNGVRALTYHPNCGMAKVAAEKTFGRSVSQAEADEWAKQKTIAFAKKFGFGVVGVQKHELCDCPDNATIHIIRPGVKNVPLKGFRINSITQNPHEAERIARAVGASRGETQITTVIHSSSARDAEKMKNRLVTNGGVQTVVVPRVR